jgi:hypothetical protein
MKEKPFLYKLFRTVLIICSIIVIALVVFYGARFLTEAPMYRMFEGISIYAIINIGLLFLTVIFFIIAWFYPTTGGIISLFPIIGYVVLASIEKGEYTASAMNYILLVIALLFIVQGLVKKYLEIDKLKDILGPTVDKYEGPDLTNLNL